MKPIIRTVKGDIEPADLGWCQCHEHLFVVDGPSRAESLYMDDMDISRGCSDRRRQQPHQGFKNWGLRGGHPGGQRTGGSRQKGPGRDG